LHKFDHEKLRDAVAAVFDAADVEADISRTVANLLVDANLSGHDSHGIQMVSYYLDCVRNGGLDPAKRGRVVSDNGAVIVIDGEKGFGAVVGAFAMDQGIARVAEHGVVLVALRNTHHLGRIGSWAERCLGAGLVSLHFVNVHGHGSLVAPFGGIHTRLGTNPVCAAVPATDENPAFVLDFATSRIAFGKVGVAYDKGEQLAPGMMIDRNGQPTTDPGTMIPDSAGGALLPLGEHKGFGLAVLCELLAGALGGGGTNYPARQGQDTTINGMLSILIDPAALGGWAPMKSEIDALYEWVVSSPAASGSDGVIFAGEPERRARAERSANGIPIARAAWNELAEAAAGLGLERASLDRIAGLAG
jgi:uncharacterized oxidoreductase